MRDATVMQLFHVGGYWGELSFVCWQAVLGFSALDLVENDAINHPLVHQVLTVEGLVAVLLHALAPLVQLVCFLEK